ncbi:hypothetical protein ACLOJK_001818 [Asimina triloba]
MRIVKIHIDENLADMMTKVVSREKKKKKKMKKKREINLAYHLKLYWIFHGKKSHDRHPDMDRRHCGGPLSSTASLGGPDFSYVRPYRQACGKSIKKQKQDYMDKYRGEKQKQLFISFINK